MTDQQQAAPAETQAPPQAPVPVVYTQVPPGWTPPAPYAPPTVESHARYTPPAPLGIGSQVDGVRLAEIGAMLGALGAEKGAATAILHMMQGATIKAFVDILPELLDKIASMNKTRFNTLMQQVQALPEVGAPAPGFFARLAGPINTGYVSKAAVLQLIAVAMERPTPTS